MILSPIFLQKSVAYKKVFTILNVAKKLQGSYSFVRKELVLNLEQIILIEVSLTSIQEKLLTSDSKYKEHEE